MQTGRDGVNWRSTSGSSTVRLVYILDYSAILPQSAAPVKAGAARRRENQPGVTTPPTTAHSSDPPDTVRCNVVDPGGAIREVDGLVAARDLQGGALFAWIDILDPTEATMHRVQDVFSLHPLAIDDAADTHARGKIDAYENFWFIVAHAFTPAADDELATTEVAIFAGDRFVITVRHTPPMPVQEIKRRWTFLGALHRDPGAFVYTLLDTIVDDYLPFVTHFESKLESIERQLLEQSERPTSSPNTIIRDILHVKSELQQMRHVVAPMQDVIARIARGDIEIFGADEMVYYRNIGTHVKRVLARIDGLNDLVTTALSLNVSIASNRQADISRQLTIIATIFLPLSFITGFFGQNFGWLVNHIQTASDFFFWGLGTELLAIALLFYFFVKRRWL